MPIFLQISLEFYLVPLKTFDGTPEFFATHDSVTVAFSNKVFFDFFKQLQMFFTFLSDRKFSRRGHFRHQFLILDLFMMDFLKSFVTNLSLLPLILLVYKGT